MAKVPNNCTISEAAEIWMRRCELEQLERATLHSYRGHVKNHIEPKIGHLLLNELSAPDVREFLDAMLQDSTRAMASCRSSPGVPRDERTAGVQCH
ncbi:hypothetical protein WKH79_02280 [Qipengyuania sp. GPGPB31]|uniref:hypothetical protein n=1 Tax=Qipengyuania sp. GPGPB31 TaxID=3023518 RepID=UPI003134463E